VVDRSRPPLSVSAIEIVQGLSSDDSRSSGGQPALAFSSSIPFSRSTWRPSASRHMPDIRDEPEWRRWCPQPASVIRSDRTCRWAGAHAKGAGCTGQDRPVPCGQRNTIHRADDPQPAAARISKDPG